MNRHPDLGNNGSLLGYVFVSPVEIGLHSYVSELSHISQGTKIGKFCCVGNLCTIGAQPHPVDRLSVFPFQRVFRHEDEWRGVPTIIGNDVWIGSNAVIMAGLTLGDGAVIGAGSVVTRDVPAYAICYGNPAKVARYRFDPGTIEALLETRWWDLPLETIKILPRESIAQCVDMLRALRG